LASKIIPEQTSPDKGIYLRGVPACPTCTIPFPDGEAGDVKNYRDDKLFAIFFTCENCHRESEFYAKYYKPKE
jgi:hypothetical protein